MSGVPLHTLVDAHASIETLGKTKPFSGWIGESLRHCVETFSLLIGDGTFNFKTGTDNDGADDSEVSQQDMALLPAMQRICQRLQK